MDYVFELRKQFLTQGPESVRLRQSVPKPKGPTGKQRIILKFFCIKTFVRPTRFGVRPSSLCSVKSKSPEVSEDSQGEVSKLVSRNGSSAISNIEGTNGQPERGEKEPLTESCSYSSRVSPRRIAPTASNSTSTSSKVL